MNRQVFKAALAFLFITLAGCGSPSSESADTRPVSEPVSLAVVPTVEPPIAPIPVATATPFVNLEPQSEQFAPAVAASSQSLIEVFPVQEAAPSKRSSRESRSESSRPRASQSSTPRTERVRREPERKASVEQGGQVWVNSNSDVYHMPGMRWYGATKEGYYTTEEKAKVEGYRRAMR